MKNLILAAVCFAALGCALPLGAQTKHVPLSEDDTEKIRESTDNPPERVKLYVKFIDERITSIKSLLAQKRPVPPDLSEQLHNLMDEFTRLVDELQDNLDAYADHHDDVRKVLKEVLEADTRWQEALTQPPPNPSYEFVRKTALEAAASTKEAAQKMLDEQTLYFKDKKDKKKNPNQE
jgi:hypothetical protein